MSENKVPTTVSGEDDLYVWTEDGIKHVQVIVDERSMVSVWTTGREPRLVFEVYDSGVDRLIDELRVARERFFDVALEGAPVRVERDASGILTARQAYMRLRRFLPDEYLQMYPDSSAREGVLTFKAPVFTSRDWHAQQVRRWPVWKREGYMRLLDALVAAEAEETAPM